MTVRHFLADDDLTAAEQEQVLNLAAEMKAEPFKYRPFEGPQSVAILTDKPTLRTQVSFHAGIAELGGNPMLVDGNLAQVGVRESIADVTRVLSRHVAAIAWRTGAQSRIEEMAAYSSVPVVNALTDEYHPCQILACLQTITEHKQRRAGLTFSYFGDGANNMANSYALGLVTAGLHVRISAPAGYHPDEAVIARARRIGETTGGTVEVIEDPQTAADGADVVCTDTWVSMGQDGAEERERVFRPYSVTSELMSHAKDDAIVMHCLPAYRGKEIAEDVLEKHAQVLFDEAENRRHAQKAILTFLAQGA